MKKYCISKNMMNALECSIKSWEYKVEYLNKRIGKHLTYHNVGCGTECALCNITGQDCFKCIIGRYTKNDACNGTPFHDCYLSDTLINNKRISLFQKEVDFLKELKKMCYIRCAKSAK